MTKTLYILDLKFLKNGSRAWPSSKEEAITAIQEGGKYTSLDTFLECRGFLENLIRDVDSWDYSGFICSALADICSDAEIPFYTWSVITELLLNDFITDDILLFLKKNSFYNLARKEDIIKGISFSFRYRKRHFSSAKSIRNVFDFIEMEKSEID